MTNSTPDASPLVYARVAGAAYLVIIIVALLNVSFIDSKLIVSGNDAATAANILANQSLFRVGIVLVLIIYTGVVVAAWALYVLLRTVSKSLALLALLFRSGEAVIGAGTALTSFMVLDLLTGNCPASAFEPEQSHALAGRILRRSTDVGAHERVMPEPERHDSRRSTRLDL